MTVSQAVNSPAGDALVADGWVRVAGIDDLPLLEGRRTTIDGRKIAVFKLLDGLAAIDAVCPHKAGPLQDGLVADNCVTCPLHDRRVDLATGQMIGYEGSVLVHDVQQVDQDVWVRLGTGPLADPSARADAEKLAPGDAMSDPHSSVPDTL